MTVYSRTDSGLLVAENASSDERAVARALKNYDPDLRLVPQGFRDGRIAYKVYRYAGSDRPADLVCVWANDAGEPYPLSGRLLEQVQRLDKNSRGHEGYASEDELNAAAKAEQARHAEELVEDLYDDWRSREGRSAALPRSPGLRQARSRSSYHESR